MLGYIIFLYSQEKIFTRKDQTAQQQQLINQFQFNYKPKNYNMNLKIIIMIHNIYMIQN